MVRPARPDRSGMCRGSVGAVGCHITAGSLPQSVGVHVRDRLISGRTQNDQVAIICRTLGSITLRYRTPMGRINYRRVMPVFVSR